MPRARIVWSVQQVAQPTALRQFVDAVLALSEHPHAETIERYLAASRSLEEARRLRLGQRSPARKKAMARAA